MRHHFDRVANFVTGPRGAWVAVAVWVPLVLVGLLAHANLGNVTAAGQNSFLPADSESTRALDALARGDGGGQEVPMLVVFDRPGGLTAGDLAAIGRLGKEIESIGMAGASPVFAPYSKELNGPLAAVARDARGVGPISRDGEAALMGLAVNAADRGALADDVAKVRRYLKQHRRPGLHSYVTGPAGMAADLETVAADAGRTLLFATLGLVLVLLLVVYRSPALALAPLLVVGSAYLATAALVYLLIEAGAITVNTEGTMLLLVLIFGAGTDYSLLLVHRYREELGRGRPAAAALPAALRLSAPAIASSAGTVIAAMLVLLLADLESTRWLGPVLAIGIATMLVASFTLLPALLALLGDRAFWPSRPVADADSSAAADRAPATGVWDRVAAFVRRRPRAIVATVCALLALLSLGNLVDHETIGFGQGETRATESGHGNEVLAKHFPPGLGSPLTVVVKDHELGAALRSLKAMEVVELAVPVPLAGDADLAMVTVLLRGNPYSNAATEAVVDIRGQLDAVAPDALVGGVPAENLDVEETNARDTRVIVPAVLLLVFAILALVLRALVAPAYLMASVVASFAATLGLVTFAFTELLGADGIGFNLVLMSFIFLIALGVDYNIFLMTRAREEARRLGTREGVLAALRSTGGVVTGAGLILAGTFATLTLLPLEQLVQIGATVALGVLLDTFVVRALMIPAITYLVGERAWWPAAPVNIPRGDYSPAQGDEAINQP